MSNQRDKLLENLVNLINEKEANTLLFILRALREERLLQPYTLSPLRPEILELALRYLEEY